MAIYHTLIGLCVAALVLIALFGIRLTLDKHRLNKMARDYSRKYRPDNAEVLNAIRDWRG